MKKIISIILSICFVLTLTACNNNETNRDSSNEDFQIVSTETESSEIAESSEDAESSEAAESSDSAESSESAESSNPTSSSHAHSYSNATCTEPAKCSCGATGGSALGHKYNEKTVSPTCTESGYTKLTCKNCSANYKTRETAALGHNWTNVEIKVVPTYTQPGECNGLCLRCNKKDSFSLKCLVATSSQIKQEMLRLINIEREKAGLKALEYYEGAQIALDARAQELQMNFSHTRPNGKNCFSVLDDYNISWDITLGENIAVGYTSVEAVMNGWMNSSGHRANILNSEYKSVAIGEYKNGWVQIFFG